MSRLIDSLLPTPIRWEEQDYVIIQRSLLDDFYLNDTYPSHVIIAERIEDNSSLFPAMVGLHSLDAKVKKHLTDYHIAQSQKRPTNGSGCLLFLQSSEKSLQDYARDWIDACFKVYPEGRILHRFFDPKVIVQICRMVGLQHVPILQNSVSSLSFTLHNKHYSIALPATVANSNTEEDYPPEWLPLLDKIGLLNKVLTHIGFIGDLEECDALSEVIETEIEYPVLSEVENQYDKILMLAQSTMIVGIEPNSKSFLESNFLQELQKNAREKNISYAGYCTELREEQWRDFMETNGYEYRTLSSSKTAYNVVSSRFLGY